MDKQASSIQNIHHVNGLHPSVPVNLIGESRSGDQ